MIPRILTAFTLLALLSSGIYAEEEASGAAAQDAPPPRYALVIGNGAYSGLSRLANPVNDANDIAAVLKHLGFEVDTLLNVNLEQMENAVLRLKENLSGEESSYGFFFYAGHGVQSGGENFLIPVDANIPGENYLRNRALSVQTVLDDLNDAGNSLNVVVLDACRDNPFGWSRSGTRGLTIVTRQPANSIIVYATSAGARANDGEGRNGLFTGQLLPNLATPGLEVAEVFRRTGDDVGKASGNQQIPAIYSQFFGTAYLGEAPIDSSGNQIASSRPVIIYGNTPLRERDPTRFWSAGAAVGTSFAAPWLMVTAQGTLAPIKYSFLELGFDFGFIPGAENVDYYSLYPFAHYCFYYPLMERLGLYVGAGGGALLVFYRFDGRDDYSEAIPIAAFTAGLKVFNMLTVSYTLRTNFSGISNRFSVGYCYRFR